MAGVGTPQQLQMPRTRIETSDGTGVVPPQQAMTPRSIGGSSSGGVPISNAVEEDQLPQGWEKALSADGYTYYINHNDQTTTYDRPTMPAMPASAQQEASLQTLNAPAEPTAEIPAVPAPWQELATPEGVAYYYNPETQVTQWERPEPPVLSASKPLVVKMTPEELEQKKIAEAAEAAAREAAERTREEQAEAARREEEEARKAEEEALKKEEEEASARMAAAVAAAADEAMAVRKEAEDAAARKADEDMARAQAEADRQAKEDDLPPGWEKATTEEGYVYYINHIEQTTTYEKPKATGEPQSPRSKLPAGWQELLTEEGTPYFYNPETGVTQWDRP